MKGILIGIVRLYQRWVSPCLPASCRFRPTCSAYMIEALEIHGVCKGFLLGIGRILRCNPFCKPGLDPVPPKGCRISKANGAEGCCKPQSRNLKQNGSCLFCRNKKPDYGQ